ncbi:SCAN domain-containing protein 3 [Caerostris darwini]|uniref:SCAN domain-containing protein 3 n=1 Tax=Caerostris darwini TaxID=1538125 RepID=A0AAV4VGC1_9ARAC|nr:SCAN domain-containing protein 3 [Caerostris darwini]
MQASTESKNKMKKRFYSKLFSKDSKLNSVLLTKRKYDSIIADVKRIKTSNKKESPRDYRIIKKYDVLTVQGCEKLIVPRSDAAEEGVKKFVHAEELFDVLDSTHQAVGHVGRHTMIKQLNALYKNVTQAQIKLFLDLCEPCQQKRKKEMVAKPVDQNARKEEDNDEEIPLEPTVVIKEEPIEFDPEPSTSSAQSVIKEEFILPNEEKTWSSSAEVPPPAESTPKMTLSVACLGSSSQEPDGDQQNQRKTRINPSKVSCSGPTKRPRPSSGSEVLSDAVQSPVYNMDEYSNAGSSKDLEKTKDQFDVFGEYIAAKLRSLDRRSCAYAQKAIGDIIFDAEMGKYAINETGKC